MDGIARRSTPVFLSLVDFGSKPNQSPAGSGVKVLSQLKEVAYAALPQYGGRWRTPQIFAQVAQVERRTQSSLDAPGTARAVVGAATCWVSFMVKLLRAYGG